MRPFLTLLILVPVVLFGQKNVKPFDSWETLKKGVEYHEKEAYGDAIREYQKISVNDTNYTSAQYEAALSYRAMKNFDSSIIVLENLLKYELSNDYVYQVYVELGNSYDDKGETDNAIKAYTAGLQKFPYQHILLYNRGLCYEKQEKYKEAALDYQASIVSNRLYAQPNFRLGIIACRMGLYDQAMLSIMMGAYLSPEKAAEKSAIAYLEEMADMSADIKKIDQTLLATDPYEDYNVFFENKTALQSNFKVKQTIKTSYGRQMELFLKNNKYDESSTDFWNANYMKFFSSVYKAGKLDMLILFSLSSIDSDEIQATIKSKIDKVKSFYQWSEPVFSDAVSNTYMTFEGKEQWVNTTYAKGLKTIGRVSASGKQIGNQYTFYSNGQVQVIMKLNEEGNSSGDWEIYTMSGHLSRTVKLLNAEGTKLGVTDYYASGEPQYKYTKVNDLFEDTICEYYRNGTVKLRYSMLADKKNGEYVSFYPNGQMREQKNYKNNVIDGMYRSWHPNGVLEDEVMVKDGELNGKRVNRYENNQISQERNYKDDLLEGQNTEYFADGKISETSTYKKGNVTGAFMSYYPNGKKSTEAEFDESGKENGTSSWYDVNENKFQRLYFSKGNLNKVEYLDKAGTAKYTSELDNKKMMLVYHYPDGREKSKGELVNGFKNGEWNNYDRYGNLRKKETFKNGVHVDTVYEYHANGQLAKKYFTKDDKTEGLYLEYNIFGDLVQEGMYLNDELVGDWYVYRNDGSMSSHHFYANGDRHGYQLEYGPTGDLASFRLLEYGNLVRDKILDTNGQVILESGVYDGEIRIPAINKKFDRLVSHYKDGEADGRFVYYTSRGTPEVEGDYLNDEKNGEWKYYYMDGKLRMKRTYLNGKLNGLSTEYYPNGNKKAETNYVMNSAEGLSTHYYSNGQKSLEGTYVNDERQGKFTSYGYKGEICMLRDYDEGVIISYNYLDATGKEKTPIIANSKEMSITTYYPNGKKGVEFKRVNGLLEGSYISYYENGQKHLVESFLHDEKNGKNYEYSETGVKILEGDYVKGSLHGWLIEYYPNGKVKSKTPYKFGDRQGWASEYAQDGKLVKQTYFHVDDEIEVKAL